MEYVKRKIFFICHMKINTIFYVCGMHKSIHAHNVREHKILSTFLLIKAHFHSKLSSLSQYTESYQKGKKNKVKNGFNDGKKGSKFKFWRRENMIRIYSLMILLDRYHYRHKKRKTRHYFKSIVSL